MAIKANRVSVGVSPTQLDDGETDFKAGHSILVKNPTGSGVTIDVGGAAVATGAGFSLAPGDAPIALDRQEAGHIMPGGCGGSCLGRPCS